MRAARIDTEQLLQLASDKLSQALENNPSPELAEELTRALQRVAVHQRAISDASTQ